MALFLGVLLFGIAATIKALVLFGMTSLCFPGLLEEFGYWGVYWRFMVTMLFADLSTDGIKYLVDGE